jgi:hypothetical protein
MWRFFCVVKIVRTSLGERNSTFLTFSVSPLLCHAMPQFTFIFLRHVDIHRICHQLYNFQKYYHHHISSFWISNNSNYFLKGL